MNKIVYLLTIIMIMPFLYGMEEKCLKLSNIEQQLVLYELKKQGKDTLLTEIRKERQYSECMYDPIRQVYYRKIPMALKIQETFYKENMETDPLTKTIFDTIQTMEKENEYCPDCNVKKEDNRLCPQCHVGINGDQWEIVGHRTEYQWLTNTNDNHLSAIQIKCLFKANPYDQKALENLINNYHQK